MKFITFTLSLVFLFSSTMFGKDPLDAGDTAPSLKVITHTGESLDLAEVYRQGPVLVYFYPKADTPGCTRQACNLRDNFEALQDKGVRVIGVSTDSVKSQSAFREKYNLPFTLVADTEKHLGNAFGMGTFMGIGFKRQSFLIVDGKVVWRDLKANPASQAADALDALASISKPE